MSNLLKIPFNKRTTSIGRLSLHSEVKPTISEYIIVTELYTFAETLWPTLNSIATDLK